MPEWIRCGTQAVAEATQGWEDHFPAWLPKAALPEPEPEPQPEHQPQTAQQSRFEQVPGVWSCEVVCVARWRCVWQYVCMAVYVQSRVCRATLCRV